MVAYSDTDNHYPRADRFDPQNKIALFDPLYGLTSCRGSFFVYFFLGIMSYTLLTNIPIGNFMLDVV